MVRGLRRGRVIAKREGYVTRCHGPGRAHRTLQDPQDHIVGQQGGSTEFNSVGGFTQLYDSNNSFISTSGGLLNIQNNSSFLNSFNETDLDLENPLPNGGPINVSTPQGGTTIFNTVDGFSQPYLPQSPYISSTLLNIQNNSPFLNIFNKTDLDLENPLPNGGPISVGIQGGTTVFNTVDGFTQPYLPQSPYISSTLTEIQNNSPSLNTFNDTSLDLENPLPNGGPIKVLAQGGTSILNTKAGFNQPYLPSKPLYDGGDTKLSDLQNSSPLPQSFDKTNLDLENPLPNGGPINVSTPQGGTTEKNLKKGYTQTFTPFKTYLNNLNLDDSSYNTLFGTSFIYG